MLQYLIVKRPTLSYKGLIINNIKQTTILQLADYQTITTPAKSLLSITKKRMK